MLSDEGSREDNKHAGVVEVETGGWRLGGSGVGATPDEGREEGEGDGGVGLVEVGTGGEKDVGD